MASGPITSWEIDGETMETLTEFLLLGSNITVDSNCTPTMKLKDACSKKESYDKPRQHFKKQRHYFANKGPSSQSCDFFQYPFSHVWMWELDPREGWVSMDWCFQTLVFEKTLKSSLDCKEIKPVNPKGGQPWISIGRTDAEAATPILWPPDAKCQLTRKDPDAGNDWGQDKNGVTQRDGMGREEGGGFRKRNTCIPVADSFWYLAKLIQLCKV